jgi:hypothetical protein
MAAECVHTTQSMAVLKWDYLALSLIQLVVELRFQNNSSRRCRVMPLNLVLLLPCCRLLKPTLDRWDTPSIRVAQWWWTQSTQGSTKWFSSNPDQSYRNRSHSEPTWKESELDWDVSCIQCQEIRNLTTTMWWESKAKPWALSLATLRLTYLGWALKLSLSISTSSLLH